MKTILLYTTKYGSVKKSAGILKKYLEGEITVVNLKTDKVPDLLDFDKIILGGSIYVGKVQKELTEFSIRNEAILRKKPLGLFINSGQRGEENLRQLKNSFPPAIFESAAVTGFFGDEINIEKCTFLDRIALRIIKKTTSSYSNIDEEAIRNFAVTFNKI